MRKPQGTSSDENKSDSEKKATTKSPKRRGKPRQTEAKTSRAKSTYFPRETLEQAIKVAQVINDDFEGKSVSLNEAAPRVAASLTGRISLGSLFTAAEMYGLIELVPNKVTLTEIGIDIIAPTSPDQRQSALLKAFSSVEVFKRVAEQYAGKRLPEHEFFKNILVREFNIARERAEAFIEVFVSNLEYLKAFSPSISGQPIFSGFVPTSVASFDVQDTAHSSSPETESFREFLDTCFILMPFGDWYDKYFKEIYVPATREAGFEPLRADGLFNIGAVMEQIWGQIQKSKVLLADLTGKNPNVFYELGLAHALRKPVVFVAGDIEDVPFDVRHLRVVVYDIREPNWAEKLKDEITAYLRSTRTEPEKSIPQPFRESSLEASTGQLDQSLIQAKKRKQPN